MVIDFAFAVQTRDVIAILSAALSLILSAIALVVSWRVHQRTRSITLYSDIDRLYLELLKLGMADPRFVDPEYTTEYETKFEPEDRAKYNIYAFIAWNICETIVDRESDPLTFQSWKPVLEFESTLHRKWFEKEANKKKFKEPFITWMSRNWNTLPTISDDHTKPG